jgi:putative ABC transport system substrate-binding protein
LLRRDFLAGLLATTTPSVLRAAEPNKVYRLAACTAVGMAAFSNEFWMRFFDRLRQLGYIEGKNLVVDRYAADGQAERYVEIAREAARSKPDVIVIPNVHQFISQVAKVTAAIPIAAAMGDPVAAGLVRNIARPEGNITGIATDAGIEMQGKHLDILLQAVPSASQIAYLSPRPD